MYLARHGNKKKNKKTTINKEMRGSSMSMMKKNWASPVPCFTTPWNCQIRVDNKVEENMVAEKIPWIYRAAKVVGALRNKVSSAWAKLNSYALNFHRVSVGCLGCWQLIFKMLERPVLADLWSSFNNFSPVMLHSSPWTTMKIQGTTLTGILTKMP